MEWYLSFFSVHVFILWFLEFIAAHHAVGYVTPVTPICHSSLPNWSPQQLMSLKPPRWVVALITNHGCLLPAAASTAAIPIIDGIFEDSPDQARLKHLSLI